MIDASRLHGMSYAKASLFGLPHVGAEYTGSGPRHYERTQGWCCVCGRPAQSVHHVVPRGYGKAFTLSSPCGTWELRSPLFALCGCGTSGCHDGFHGGARYRARWVWDEDEYEWQWWDGLMLAEHGPHSPMLYLYGQWEIDDARTGRTLVIREAV